MPVPLLREAHRQDKIECGKNVGKQPYESYRTGTAQQHQHTRRPEETQYRTVASGVRRAQEGYNQRTVNQPGTPGVKPGCSGVDRSPALCVQHTQ